MWQFWPKSHVQHYLKEKPHFHDNHMYGGLNQVIFWFGGISNGLPVSPIWSEPWCVDGTCHSNM